jgi:hypothetical protein
VNHLEQVSLAFEELGRQASVSQELAQEINDQDAGVVPADGRPVSETRLLPWTFELGFAYWRVCMRVSDASAFRCACASTQSFLACSPLNLLKEKSNQGVTSDFQGFQEFAGAVNELVGTLPCGLNPGPKPTISKLFGVEVKTQRQYICQGGINKKVCDSFFECLNRHSRIIECGGASFYRTFWASASRSR